MAAALDASGSEGLGQSDDAEAGPESLLRMRPIAPLAIAPCDIVSSYATNKSGVGGFP